MPTPHPTAADQPLGETNSEYVQRTGDYAGELGIPRSPGPVRSGTGRKVLSKLLADLDRALPPRSIIQAQPSDSQRLLDDARAIVDDDAPLDQTLFLAPVARIEGICPACTSKSLFVGEGGHVTCARFACPDPAAVDDLLHTEPEPERPQTGAEAVAELSRDDLAAAGDALTERFDRLERLLHDQWAHRFDAGAPLAELTTEPGRLEPTEAELWQAALGMAAAQRDRRKWDPASLLEQARWFYNELMLGPGRGCPTCSGATRETAGMVCQTCGTDYGRPSLLDVPQASSVRVATAATGGYAGELGIPGRSLAAKTGEVVDPERVPGGAVDMGD
jgi:hypothetical protein